MARYVFTFCGARRFWDRKNNTGTNLTHIYPDDFA